ncbi:hypothetical protein [Bacillus sp. CHD6a]|uniref:hypothetical protein n=1 Tax=Bacillus sp. CHD6a TaxID=1643452 RepID=UPI0006CCACE4|nr:hypothetical protein [Bacillus sp. CHD6a]KPB03961.1 hypothetical protein AAV98_14580 [Bacillus sp. CHD6a]
MVISVALLCMIVSIYVYNRYVPVLGVPCVKDLENTSTVKTIDVRDYNYVDEPVQAAVNIPVAYLQRNYQQFQGDKVVVLASSHMEKNISVRYLKKKGIEVIGYRVIGNSCKCPKLKMV